MAAQDSSIAGKTAIVTGGANGLGKAYVQALSEAGVYVVFGDLNVEVGKKLESETKNTKFISTNVTKWEDQVHLFQSAVEFSPSNKIHYVVANAGIAAKEDLFEYNPSGPTKPTLPTLDVNLYGTIYTAKLAMHHFISQNGTTQNPNQEDTCLILIGSGASHFDVPRSPTYVASKWAARGIMHALRRTAHHYGSRVNMIAPWYVSTNILAKETCDYIKSCGVEFAEAADAGRALVHILGDTGVNGRSFFIAPRKWAKEGFVDLEMDEVPEEGLLGQIQRMQMASAPPETGLFVGGPGVNTK